MHVRRHVVVAVHVVADVHERAVAAFAQRRDDALEKRGVPRPEAAERDVDQRPVVVGREGRHLVGRLLPYAAFEILELLGVERMGAAVGQRLGVEHEVQMGRGLEELAQRIGLFAAVREEGVEVVVDRPDHFIEAVAEGLVAGGVLFAHARQMRRDRVVLDLVLGARDHAHPWHAVLLDRGEEDDVVDGDDVGLDLGKDARQVLLRPFRAVDDRGPAVLHVVVDLVDRLLGEVRDVAVDEVLPELGHLLGGHGFRQRHGMRLEAVALVDRDEPWVGQEHRLVAARGDRLRDADRVQRGAEGGLGEECEGLL